MKALIIALLGLMMIAQPLSAQKKKDGKKPMTEKKDKISYSIGHDLGKNFKEQGIEINADLVANGIKDALSGGKTALTDEEMENILKGFQMELQAKRTEAMNKEAEKANVENQKFFEENGKKEGVITTASGLQYKVLSTKNDSGKSPKATNTVKVHYKGSLLNGKVFDSSYDRNEPIEFPLNGVIPGWTEGVQLMKEGDKFEFYIPSQLGYGARGAGGVIPPNAALIFVVELLEVK